MRYLLIILVFFISVSAYSDNPVPSSPEYTQKPNANTSNNKKKTTEEQRGTEGVPVFVKVIAADRSEEEAKHDHYEHNEKPSLDRGLTYATIALAAVTAILAFFTYGLWRDARRTSKQTISDMRSSIAEAARSATAMEVVAAQQPKMQNIMYKQMRAYIAVDVGKAISQNSDLRFEADPIIVNTGFTPAKNVSTWIKAAILDPTVTHDYLLKENGEFRKNDATLNPRQTFTIFGIVRDRYSIEEVVCIMEGVDKRLFVWGAVSYEDVFGGKWETNFCHNYVFYKTGDEIGFSGYYYNAHNNST